jgi:CrcB protein
MRVLVQIGLVTLGSALGGLSRWSVGMAAARLLGTALPYGTFFINITGSLFLGWFLTVLADRFTAVEHTWLHPDDLRLLVAIGFAGSYTTFSTFEWESHGLFRDGDGLAGTMYILGSVLAGLVAIRLGIQLARIT